MQPAEFGEFLVLMILHPAEQKSELIYRFQQMRPLVKHDAFRPGRHGRIRHFAARRRA